MSSLKDYRNKWSKAISAYDQQKIQIAEKASADAIATALDRVINEAELADGRKLEYAESTKKQKLRRRTPSTFPFMNFSDTNQMWRSVRTLVESQSKGLVELRITATGDREEIMGFQEDETEIPLTALNDTELVIVIQDWIDCNNEFLETQLK